MHQTSAQKIINAKSEKKTNRMNERSILSISIVFAIQNVFAPVQKYGVQCVRVFFLSENLLMALCNRTLWIEECMFKSSWVVAVNKRKYPLYRTYCKNLDNSLSEPLHFIRKKVLQIFSVSFFGTATFEAFPSCSFVLYRPKSRVNTKNQAEFLHVIKLLRCN